MNAQGTPEWFAERIGKFTGSAAADWVCQEGRVTVKANTYVLKKLGEIKTGEPSDGFVNDDMIHGQEQEPKARAWYEKLTGNKVEEVGFIHHPTIPFVGASVDGKVKILIDDYGIEWEEKYEGVDEVNGTIEIKCPALRNLHIHLKHCTISSTDEFKKAVPAYYWQSQTGMLCTGAAFCDFVSFYPFLADKSGFFTFRLPFDEKAGKIIEDSAIMCYEEMCRLAKQLNIEIPYSIPA